MNNAKYKIQLDRLKEAKKIIKNIHFEDIEKINLRIGIEIAILKLQKKLEEDSNV